jgi:hypothetical protein
MISSRNVITAWLAFSVLALGTAAGAVGGSGSQATAAKPSARSLTAVRNSVEQWLQRSGFKGFHVSEVMAFSLNDYVAVHDRKGNPAFELLTDPNLGWLMEEPPSMMWNTRYGMMGGIEGWPGRGNFVAPMMGGWMMGGGWNGWYGGGATGPVKTVAKAVEVADRWLARARPGERVESDAGEMSRFPGYYTLDTVRKGKIHGMLSVNAASGAVWYHGWHGRFLAEKDF